MAEDGSSFEVIHGAEVAQVNWQQSGSAQCVKWIVGDYCRPPGRR